MSNDHDTIVRLHGVHALKVKMQINWLLLHFTHNLYIMIGLWRCHATRVAYMDGRTDGRTRVGQQARAAGGERRPATGRNRRLGRRLVSQNRDVTTGAWLTRMDGRAGGYKQSSRRRSWWLVYFKHWRHGAWCSEYDYQYVHAVLSLITLLRYLSAEATVPRNVHLSLSCVLEQNLSLPHWAFYHKLHLLEVVLSSINKFFYQRDVSGSAKDDILLLLSCSHCC